MSCKLLIAMLASFANQGKFIEYQSRVHYFEGLKKRYASGTIELYIASKNKIPFEPPSHKQFYLNFNVPRQGVEEFQEIEISIRERKAQEGYFLDRVKNTSGYRIGKNSFAWDSRVLKKIRVIPPQDLCATVKIIDKRMKRESFYVPSLISNRDEDVIEGFYEVGIRVYEEINYELYWIGPLKDNGSFNVFVKDSEKIGHRKDRVFPESYITTVFPPKKEKGYYVLAVLDSEKPGNDEVIKVIMFYYSG